MQDPGPAGLGVQLVWEERQVPLFLLVCVCMRAQSLTVSDSF